MTYIARPNEFIRCGENRSAGGARAIRRRGLLRRIYEAMSWSREKQAERAVAAYLEGLGGRFTDEIERRITERLVTGQWRR